MMEGLVRKRTRSEYNDDDEIQFNKRPRSPAIVDPEVQFNKRPRPTRSIKVNKSNQKKIKPKAGQERRSLRIRRNSFESTDGSESSRDSNQSISCDGDPDISFKRDFSCVFLKHPQLQATTTAPSSTIPASSLDDSTEEADERKVNRRSPNGFLLADPLPKGEVLRDSRQQGCTFCKYIIIQGHTIVLFSNKISPSIAP